MNKPTTQPTMQPATYRPDDDAARNIGALALTLTLDRVLIIVIDDDRSLYIDARDLAADGQVMVVRHDAWTASADTTWHPGRTAAAAAARGYIAYAQANQAG